MTKLEEKLIELGYFAQFGIGYIKRINSFAFCIHIMKDNQIYYSINTFGKSWLDKQDIDNLQQAFNQLTKDLEELREYENKSV